MSKEEVLREYGLTNNEVNVYLTTLMLGSSKVNGITKRVNLPRTTIYNTLRMLMDKGLISYVIISGVRYFQAAKPIKFLSNLKEKEEKIKSILSELESIQESITDKPKVEFYEKKEGIKTIYENILKTKKTIHCYGSPKFFFEFLKYFGISYIKRRVKSKIFVKIIADKSKEAKIMKSKDKYEYRETRILEQVGKVNFQSYVYENKYAVLTMIGKEPVGIIIENEEIAKAEKLIFDKLWEMAGS